MYVCVSACVLMCMYVYVFDYTCVRKFVVFTHKCQKPGDWLNSSPYELQCFLLAHLFYQIWMIIQITTF